MEIHIWFLYSYSRWRTALYVWHQLRHWYYTIVQTCFNLQCWFGLGWDRLRGVQSDGVANVDMSNKSIPFGIHASPLWSLLDIMNFIVESACRKAFFTIFMFELPLFICSVLLRWDKHPSQSRFIHWCFVRELGSGTTRSNSWSMASSCRRNLAATVSVTRRFCNKNQSAQCCPLVSEKKSWHTQYVVFPLSEICYLHRKKHYHRLDLTWKVSYFGSTPSSQYSWINMTLAHTGSAKRSPQRR